PIRGAIADDQITGDIHVTGSQGAGGERVTSVIDVSWPDVANAFEGQQIGDDEGATALIEAAVPVHDGEVRATECAARQRDARVVTSVISEAVGVNCSRERGRIRLNEH